MERLLEYLASHPVLVACTAATVAAAIAYEIYVSRSSGAAVSPSDAVRLLNQGAVLVDVRSKELFEAGHVIDARNLPSAEIAKAGETLKKYKDKVVIACCETGLSSGAAVRALQAQGFEKAVNLRGGLQAWRADNLPLVKGDGRNDGKGKG
jgi:rhodanese-related sulfurtransferase